MIGSKSRDHHIFSVLQNTMNDQLTLNRLFGFADDESIIPSARIRSEWTKENKHGFLSAIAKYGLPHHKIRLNGILASNSPDRTTEIDDFIDVCFNYYIAVFKQHVGSNCHTPTSSRTPSRSNSVHDINDNLIQELSHSQFKKSVGKRDGVCLFCWNNLQCHAAHLVAQKDLPFDHDEQSIFQRTGLHSKHQVQNGMLLCSVCHGEFDALKRYVDVIVEENGDVKYVLKIVKGLRESDEEEWEIAISKIKSTRQVEKRRFSDRAVVDSGEEMELWFISPFDDTLNDRETRSRRVLEPADLRPNIKALEFHKTACLIWCMAGGAEEDEEYCSDDDSDADQENIPYEQRTKDFVSATAVFKQSLLEHPDLACPK